MNVSVPHTHFLPLLKDILLTIFLVAIPSGAVDSIAVSSFVNNRPLQLQHEYEWCTDDTMKLSISMLLDWKARLHSWVETDEYQKLLNDFYAETGLDAQVHPCEIKKWYRNKLRIENEEIERAQKAQQEYRKMVEESTQLAIELNSLPRSDFDFMGFPFGLKKRTFAKLFPKKFSAPMEISYNDITLKDVNISGTQYMVKLYFGRKDSLYRYEIQSESYGVDSIDSHVRVLAEKLAEIFEKRAGDCYHHYRVGRLDITQGRITPYKTWLTPRHTVLTGFGTYKYRYYAKALVTDKEIEATQKRRYW